MGIFFVYILKSAICLALFYLFYRLLLSKETFHRFNRVALLGLLLFSCLLPLIEVSAGASNEINRGFVNLEELMMNGLVADTDAPVSTTGWRELLLLFYIIGILFFFLRHLWSLGRMLVLIKGCKRQPMEDGISLFTHQKEIAPFSWMKNIVISEKDRAESGDAILTHERAHIANRHSWDLLLADFCLFFQWFNPAAWLLKQELQNIHEYEADEWVLNQGIDAKTYQLLLIKKAVGTRLYSMANNLNHSNLKKRITMMIKKKSNPWARMKYLYILPLAAVAVAAFARPEVSNQFDEISSVKVNDLVAIEKTNGTENEKILQDTAKSKEIFMVVEEMPQYPGGMGELRKFLGENIKYPEEAKKAKIQGRVITRFIVEKDGSISDIEVLRKVNPELDAEAIRVLKLMPKWIPGMQKGEPVRVKFTIPVHFSLDEPAQAPASTKGVTIKVDSEVPMGTVDAVREELRKNGQHRINLSTDSNKKAVSASKALIIVDGVEKAVGTDVISSLNPNDIKLIEVMKEQAAIEKYGEKGKHGVIIITTRQAAAK